jgi:hypothetical protein
MLKILQKLKKVEKKKKKCRIVASKNLAQCCNVFYSSQKLLKQSEACSFNHYPVASVLY